MSYPLLSLILEARGVSPELIGINSAMSPIGILLSASIIPVAARKFGSRNLAIVAALLTGVLFICFKVFDRLDVWFILRLLQGMTVATLFVLSETWIVNLAAFQGNELSARHRVTVPGRHTLRQIARPIDAPVRLGQKGS